MRSVYIIRKLYFLQNGVHVEYIRLIRKARRMIDNAEKVDDWKTN